MTSDIKEQTSKGFYAWSLLVLFTLTYTFSFVDRQVINLLVEPIKGDMGLTDVQISYLQGLIFVIPYVLLSIPIGRLVDVFSRIYVIISGILVWSFATIAAGLSGNYTQLAIARGFVGAGEAALTPAVWSMFPDIFTKKQLAVAMSIFSMAPYLGAGIALIAGAQVIEVSQSSPPIELPIIGTLEPWQITLIICGAPGILFALIYACIKEPARTSTETQTDEAMPLSEAVDFIRKNWKVYLAFLGGAPFLIIMLYSIQAWSPTLLIRVHEWDISYAGRVYGVVALGTGSLGVLSSPVIARVMNNLNFKGYPLLMLMMSTVLTALFLFIAGLQKDGMNCLVFLALASFFVTIPLPQLAVTLQTISPNKMRGLVAGIFVVSGNVMGMGLGPTFVAFFTENVFQDPMSVGLSMGLLGLVSAPIALVIYLNGYRDLLVITESEN
ncbi:MAG: MFS transporter [Alphaproteobacteria bacterium]|nr:MFS transporter [Alphaproteobacteria bacterium]